MRATTNTLVVAAVQTRSTADEAANIATAVTHVTEACEAGAQLVALPENFGLLADRRVLLEKASPLEGHPHLLPLVELARRYGVHILAGSVPERTAKPTHISNTSVLLSPTGDAIAVYRKIHLFDATLSGGQSLCESDHVTPGDALITADVGPFRLGMSICYDLRFPELYRGLVDKGASLITIPSAFTLHTGKDHWEPLIRARAIESQSYVVAPAQWGEHGGGRYSWGKSMIVDPWGATLAVAPEAEGFVLARIDLAYLNKVRDAVPSLRHRRL